MSLQWIKTSLSIERLAQMEDFSLRPVEIRSRRICLVKLPDGVYAIDDKCPHAGARLSFGSCDGNGIVTCPVHRYKFSAQTGKGFQGDFVTSYPVEVRDDGIYIGFRRRFLLF